MPVNRTAVITWSKVDELLQILLYVVIDRDRVRTHVSKSGK